MYMHVHDYIIIMYMNHSLLGVRYGEGHTSLLYVKGLYYNYNYNILLYVKGLLEHKSVVEACFSVGGPIEWLLLLRNKLISKLSGIWHFLRVCQKPLRM